MSVSVPLQNPRVLHGLMHACSLQRSTVDSHTPQRKTSPFIQAGKSSECHFPVCCHLGLQSWLWGRGRRVQRNVAGSQWSPHRNFICIKYTVSSVSLTQKKMICCSNFLLCFPPKYIITIFSRQSSIFGALFMPFRHRELGKNRDSDKQKVVGSNDCLYFLLLSQCLLLS